VATNDDKPIDEQTVEELLRMRYASERDGECAELGQVAQVLAGEGDGDDIDQAVGHLRACDVCCRAVVVAEHAEARANRSEQGAEVGAPGSGPWPSPRTGRRSWTPRLAWAGSLAAAALLAVVLTTAIRPTVDGPTGPGGGGELVPKGATDRVTLAVQRGTKWSLARPGDRLLPGDQFGFFYTASAPGYLAVLHVDESKEPFVLHPLDGERSAPAPAGENVRVEGGGEMTAGKGCEWFVTVFSDTPLRTDDLKDRLRRATLDAAACELGIEVPEARTVRVFPVRR